MTVDVVDCEETKNEFMAADNSCLPLVGASTKSEEAARISDWIAGVLLTIGSLSNVVLAATFFYVGAIVLKGGKISGFVLPVMCICFAILILLTVLSGQVFLDICANVQRAFSTRRANRILQDSSCYRRTLAEYERDVMNEVNRLTDAVIDDATPEEDYTHERYVSDVREEAVRTMNAVVSEMGCGDALDTARSRERTVVRYRKDVQDNAAKIVDSVVKNMKLSSECDAAVQKERKSAQYKDDIKSEADRVVDCAIKGAKEIYGRYCDSRKDNDDVVSADISQSEARVLISDLLKHVKVENVHGYGVER